MTLLTDRNRSPPLPVSSPPFCTRDPLIARPIRRIAQRGWSSPVVWGKRVYAYFGDVGLYCYDFEGNPLWSRKCGSFPTRFGWGTAASPAQALRSDRGWRERERSASGREETERSGDADNVRWQPPTSHRLPPVPEPVPVVFDQLEVRAFLRRLQFDQRQVDLKRTLAGLAEDPVELIRDVPRWVE